jgi:hypothetical protein
VKVNEYPGKRKRHGEFPKGSYETRMAAQAPDPGYD